jgi:hypothetical protein
VLGANKGQVGKGELTSVHLHLHLIWIRIVPSFLRGIPKFEPSSVSVDISFVNIVQRDNEHRDPRSPIRGIDASIPTSSSIFQRCPSPSAQHGILPMLSRTQIRELLGRSCAKENNPNLPCGHHFRIEQLPIQRWPRGYLG